VLDGLDHDNRVVDTMPIASTSASSEMVLAEKPAPA